MNYRFVKVTNYYKNFLNHYYRQNPNVVQLSYQQQHDHLMKEAFGWSNFFQIHLNKLGNEAFEIVANAEPLQLSWAKEHHITSRGEGLLLEQLKFYKPEIIFFQDSLSFDYSFIKDLKQNIPSVRMLIGWCCSPYTKQQFGNYKVFDFVFACSPGFVNALKNIGVRAYRLNHAFESSLLPAIKKDNAYPETDFIFIGSFIGSKAFHNERIKLIEELLASQVKLSLYTNLPKDNMFNVYGQQLGYSASKLLKSVGLETLAMKIPLINKAARLTEMPARINLSEEFKKASVLAPLYGLEMFKAISKSKIGFNSHGGVAGDYAANIRLFEVTGVGSCLLTDDKKNISDFFEPDKEIVTYKSPDACKEKINWLLSHPNEMKEIAIAGQKKTLKEHTFERRAESLNEIIKAELKK
jgi:spore maturation protein CgeB